MRNSEAILAKGRFRTDVFKFSFFNRIVNLWNDLPVAIKTIDLVSLFSKKVNQFYISNLFSLHIYCCDHTRLSHGRNPRPPKQKIRSKAG